MTVPDKPLISYIRVRRWLEDYEKSWGPDDEPAQKAKLEALSRFCAFVAKDPDEIVGECLRTLDDGGEKVRFKVRHHYVEKINEFEANHGGGRHAANSVRSFFIHNGVMMGGRILR